MAAYEGPAGTWRLKIYDTLGSTSDLCRNFALEGEPEGLAVLARRQERGRGRAGRTWISAPGNLFLSVLLRPRGLLRSPGLWSLLAAVALAETLAPLVPDAAALTLKWPNDLLLSGRKLAGVLLDSAANGSGGLDWLVIGFGVNLASAPELPDRAVATLAETAPPRPPEEVAEALLARLDQWRALAEAEGPAPVRAAWLRFAHPLGTPLTLNVGDTAVVGSFAGIADDGSLLLNTGDRTERFAAGEIAAPAKG